MRNRRFVFTGATLATIAAGAASVSRTLAFTAKVPVRIERVYLSATAWDQVSGACLNDLMVYSNGILVSDSVFDVGGNGSGFVSATLVGRVACLPANIELRPGDVMTFSNYCRASAATANDSYVQIQISLEGITPSDGQAFELE